MKKLMNTSVEGFKFRFAEAEDTGLILQFIKELAEYENLCNEVTATEELLRHSLFDKNIAEVIIGEYNDEHVSFALFFHNFSTFLGKPGIYLEDLFVRPHMRGKGLGKATLAFLAALCKERGCGRLEWACLDWNEPSINFYKSMGAVPNDEWTTYRVTGSALDELSKK